MFQFELLYTLFFFQSIDPERKLSCQPSQKVVFLYYSKEPQ